MRPFLAAIFVLLLAGVPARAEDDADPIDDTLSQCMDSPDGQSTQGMVECLDAAYKSWDQALNDAYSQEIQTLEPKERDLLKASQRQWITYRDAERAFLAALETDSQGTIWRITTNQAMVDMVKARVLLLRSYLPEEH